MPTTAAEPALALDHVSLVRDGRIILHPLDWQRAERTERWLVLGANGSGKTTLLRIASLYVHPTTGQVTCSASASAAPTSACCAAGSGWPPPRSPASSVRSSLAEDVVMTAKYAALEPWWHRYDDEDRERARACLAPVRRRALRRADARHAVVRRAAARPAGAIADDRSRHRAARRAERPARPRWPGVARRGARLVRRRSGARRRSCSSRTTSTRCRRA